MKARNAIFCTLVSLLLFLCIGNGIYHAVTGKEASKSYLEGRTYQEFPELTLDTVADGTFQSEAEQFVADLIPRRNSVLLANASLQRLGIKSANLAFNYPAVPTFFGSEYLECPGYRAVVESPSKQSVETPKVLADAAALFNDAIDSHPDIHWQIALVDRSMISLANPAHDLVADPADYTYYRNNFVSLLTDNCTFTDLSISDSEEYFKSFFHTDHHWQAEGGANAYTAIMQAFGRDPVAPIEFQQAYAGPFYGSEARNGLITSYSDTVDDTTIPIEGLTVNVDGVDRSARWLNSRLDPEWAGYEKTNRFTNIYGDYFHGDPGLLTIHNENGSGTLLIVGDSFTNNIDSLFALDYETVYVIDPRHFDGTLEEFLKDNQVDDAVFLMASNTIISDKTASFLS